MIRRLTLGSPARVVVGVVVVDTRERLSRRRARSGRNEQVGASESSSLTWRGLERPGADGALSRSTGPGGSAPTPCPRRGQRGETTAPRHWPASVGRRRTRRGLRAPPPARGGR